jgi:hypothetical protein
MTTGAASECAQRVPHLQNSETAALKALQSGSQMRFEIRSFLVRFASFFFHSILLNFVFFPLLFSETCTSPYVYNTIGRDNYKFFYGLLVCHQFAFSLFFITTFFYLMRVTISYLFTAFLIYRLSLC